MKTASVGYLNGLKEELTFLCRIWTLTLASGQVWRFTDRPSDFMYDGNVYSASPGVQISAVRSAVGVAVPNCEINIACSDDFITKEDVQRGALDNATFTVESVQYKNPERGAMILFAGRLGSVTFTDRGHVTCSVDGLSKSASRGIGEIYSPNCRNDVFDARCGLLEATYSVNGSVDAVKGSNTGFTCLTLGQDAAYFDDGRVTFTSGDNSGVKAEVRKFEEGGLVHLYLALPYPLQVGDTFSIVPGCSKQPSMCLARYNNIRRFRGEPHVPGQDARTFQVG